MEITSNCQGKVAFYFHIVTELQEETKSPFIAKPSGGKFERHKVSEGSVGFV